jgi:protein involved in polysaccharide export with SLBB domain
MIRIAVWRRPEFSGDFQIALDGTIVHPLFRKITAARTPIPDVERRIREYLLQFEATPEFVILPLFRVFVAGEVRAPAVLNVPPGTTLGQAIGLAGGPTEDARLDQVRLVRNLTTKTYDLAGRDSLLANLELGSSDQIFVARRQQFMRDRLLPMSAVIAAFTGLANLILLSSRR